VQTWTALDIKGKTNKRRAVMTIIIGQEIKGCEVAGCWDVRLSAVRRRGEMERTDDVLGVYIDLLDEFLGGLFRERELALELVELVIDRFWASVGQMGELVGGNYTGAPLLFAIPTLLVTMNGVLDRVIELVHHIQYAWDENVPRDCLSETLHVFCSSGWRGNWSDT
jgi:hypothetical protein